MRHGSVAISGQGGPDAAPLVVAHRGAWKPAPLTTTAAGPQNSVPAFLEAVALGCDAVELDVRRTADGALVVVHDARVAWRQVGTLTLDELRRRRPRHGQPAMLEDVLERLGGRIGLDIELKEDGYAGQVMALVARYLTPDQYVVTSFRDAVLPAVKSAVPEARTGLLLTPRWQIGQLQRRVAAARADFVAPHERLARGDVLAWAAARGLPCWVWTVNGSRTLRSLAGDPRVAAIITDRPDRALAARAALATGPGRRAA